MPNPPQGLRRDASRLAVRGRGDQQADEPLRVPAVVHITHREPVQKFRMAGGFALRAEVLFLLDEPLPERLRPTRLTAARGEWIIPIDQPAGQSQPVRGNVRRKRAEERRERRDQLRPP